MGKSRQPRQTRHPTPFPGVYRRSKKDELSGEIIPYGKCEPRMKPRREQLSSGEKLIHEHLPLGGYDTPEEAKNVHDIAAFYYEKAKGELALPNGQVFSIPAMTEEEKQSLHGMEKRQWVCRKAREVFEDFQKALKAATRMRNGALVSSEVAMTVVASPEILGSPQTQIASLSLEDSTLDPIFGDLQFDNVDIRSGFPTALDSLLSLPSLSWDEGIALASTSQETTSMEMHRVQQQLWESQCENLELQRQLGQAQRQNVELQRQMECVRSELQQRCCRFCLQEPDWIP